MKYDVFISYSRRDYAIADRIVSALSARGFTYFRDQQGIEPGSDFLLSIIKAINSSRLFLCILSGNAYSSEFVLKEIEYALHQKECIILPVIVDNVPLPDRLKFSLGHLHFANWQFFGSHNAEDIIIRDISRALERLEDNLSVKKKENDEWEHQIFISYKRDDSDMVFPIKDKIELNTGKKCWIDLDGIESDDQFVNVIIKAINKANVFLFMYSHSHAEIEDYEKDWTVREISFAQKKNKRIVFVNIDNTPLTDWFEMMFGLKQQVDATSNSAMDRLYKDLKKWLG